MKHCLWVHILLITLSASPLWAQPKQLVKGVLAAQAAPRVHTRRVPDVAQLIEQTRAFLLQHHGNLPKRTLYQDSRAISTYDMNEEQLLEVRLARQVYYQLKNNPNPTNPQWQQLSALYTIPATLEPIGDPSAFLAQLNTWMQNHKGLRPRLNIYKNGTPLTAQELRQNPPLYEEHTLARRLNYLLHFKGVLDSRVREKLNELASAPTVTRRENPTENQFYDGFNNALPTLENEVEKLEQWAQSHRNTRPRLIHYKNGKRIPVSKMSPQQYEEYRLAFHLNYFLKKKRMEGSLYKRLLSINSLPIWQPDNL